MAASAAKLSCSTWNKLTKKTQQAHWRRGLSGTRGHPEPTRQDPHPRRLAQPGRGLAEPAASTYPRQWGARGAQPPQKTMRSTLGNGGRRVHSPALPSRSDWLGNTQKKPLRQNIAQTPEAGNCLAQPPTGGAGHGGHTRNTRSTQGNGGWRVHSPALPRRSDWLGNKQKEPRQQNRAQTPETGSCLAQPPEGASAPGGKRNAKNGDARLPTRAVATNQEAGAVPAFFGGAFMALAGCWWRAA